MTHARRLTTVLLAAFVLAAGFVAIPRAAHADSGTVYQLLNEARRAAGLGGLHRDGNLDVVAQRWTQQMVNSGTLAHNPNLSREVPAGWRNLGENVAKGYTTDQALHNAWMNSEGHRANILGSYSSVGIGYVKDGAGKIWATQVFATYPGVAGPAKPAAAPAVCPASPQQSGWSQPSGQNLGFVPVTPARLLDSRSNQVVSGGCQIGPRSRIDVQVSGQAGIPSSGVAAVMLNLVCVSPRTETYLAAYPAGGTWSGTSSVNGLVGQDVAASVIVPVGTGGKVSIVSGDGACGLVVDVTGYFPSDGSGSKYVRAGSPSRIADGTHTARTWSALGTGVPAGASAVVGNVVLDNPREAGYGAISPSASGTPSASTVNVNPGTTGANRFVLPTDSSGRVAMFTSSTTRAVVDVTGWFATSGASYRPLAPTRVVDSRTGSGIGGALVGGQPQRVTLAGGGVPAGASAVAVSVTLTGSSLPTYLTAYQAGTARPATSDLNVAPGGARANLVILPVDAQGRADLVIGQGRSDVVVDVLGYFG